MRNTQEGKTSPWGFGVPNRVILEGEVVEISVHIIDDAVFVHESRLFRVVRIGRESDGFSAGNGWFVSGWRDFGGEDRIGEMGLGRRLVERRRTEQREREAWQSFHYFASGLEALLWSGRWVYLAAIFGFPGGSVHNDVVFFSLKDSVNWINKWIKKLHLDSFGPAFTIYI